MKFYTLKGALERLGTKKAIAEQCNVSPAAVSKAFEHNAAEPEHKYKVMSSGGALALVIEQPKWRKVVGR